MCSAIDRFWVEPAIDCFKGPCKASWLLKLRVMSLLICICEGVEVSVRVYGKRYGFLFGVVRAIGDAWGKVDETGSALDPFLDESFSPPHHICNPPPKLRMQLHAFGHNVASPPPSVLCAKAFKILWSSWCDAVLAHQDDGDTWAIEYRGTGLTKIQKSHIESSQVIRESVGAVELFGTAMHDGLRGYVLQRETNEVLVFATDLEMERGVAEIETFAVSAGGKMKVVMESNGHVLMSTVAPKTGEAQIIHLNNITALRQYLDAKLLAPAPPTIVSSKPVQFRTNSTTATMLDGSGQVLTATRDPRYPRCLGRPHERTDVFKPVPYLSETRITKIASGGYMTAAVSSEGELFIWGQACPGSVGELAVLSGNDAFVKSQRGSKKTGVSADEEQDDMVKCLTVLIDGQDAHVYDVVVGHGHILVAAQVQADNGGVRRVVFAGGENGRGQLGCMAGESFVPGFVEVSKLRDRKIVEMAASGWSSYMVTAEG
jgi:hypothetical protein